MLIAAATTSALIFFGLVALLVLLMALAVSRFRALGRRYQASVKQCPECLSTVPAQATVCRYCQHRFG